MTTSTIFLTHSQRTSLPATLRQVEMLQLLLRMAMEGWARPKQIGLLYKRGFISLQEWGQI